MSADLTAEQQLALALDRNVSVTAGAGSGKTKILVERFLKIALANPGKLRRILAITFTKKAAGEMQERVAAEVHRLLEENSDPDQRQTLLRIRDQLSQASVSTIHGFCARVLREYPIEAGLSPDFNEMDDLQQTVLIQQAIEDTFNVINAGNGSNYLNLFSRLGKTAVEAMLQMTLTNPYEIRQLHNRFSDYSVDSYLDFLYSAWIDLVRVQVLSADDYRTLIHLAQQFVNLDRPLFADDAKAAQAMELLRAAAAVPIESEMNISGLGAVLALLPYFTTKDGRAYKNVGKLGTKKSWSPSAQKLLMELSAFCAPAAQRILKVRPGLPDTAEDSLWFSLLQSFFLLYEESESRLTELKLTRGWLDFDDLQLYALRLLQENETVRTQLAQRYEYIMVDEFQDTNALQWEIIHLLAKTKAGLAKDKLFIVGDPKQSIYGFRNADIRVFRRVKKLFSEIGSADGKETDIVFAGSFRFLPRLNAFINHLFSRMLRERAQNLFEVGYDSLKAMRNVPDSGSSSLTLLDEDISEEAYVAATIKRLMQDKSKVQVWEKKEIERPLRYGDIAILLRGRTHLLEMELALRNLNIPYKTVKGVGFWQKQEVYDLFYLLRFLSNPADNFSLIAVLRSPIFFISDETLYFLSKEEGTQYRQKMEAAFSSETFPAENKKELEPAVHLLDNWLNLRDRMALSDFFEILLNDLRLKAFYLSQINGEQLTANVEKVLQQAQTFGWAGLGGLNEFVSYMEMLMDKQMREGEAQLIIDDTESVKLMTIHAAKGLQFPYVFVPYLNSKSNSRVPAFLMDSELGLAQKPPKDKPNSNVLYRMLHFRQRQKEQAEAKRVFYVAVSRAESAVFLSAQLKKGKIKAGTILSELATIFENLDSAESIGLDGFTLKIEREVDLPPTAEKDFTQLTKGLQHLNRLLSQSPKAGEAPAYLRPILPGADIRTFSPTRIMTYVHDKQAYYQKYHLGFFESDYEAFAEDILKDEFALLKGKIVHRFLERRAEHDRDEMDLIESILFEFEVFDPVLQQRFREELQIVAQKIMVTAEAKTIVFAETAQNELTVTMRVGQDYVSGALDRIYKNSEGLWEVVDYKTNRITAEEIEKESRRYQWQIHIYALMLSKLYPQQRMYPVRLYFLHPNHFWLHTYSMDDLKLVERDLENITLQIKSDFPLQG